MLFYTEGVLLSKSHLWNRLIMLWSKIKTDVTFYHLSPQCYNRLHVSREVHKKHCPTPFCSKMVIKKGSWISIDRQPPSNVYNLMKFRKILWRNNIQFQRETTLIIKSSVFCYLLRTENFLNYTLMIKQKIEEVKLPFILGGTRNW